MSLTDLISTADKSILIEEAMHGNLDAFNQLVLQNQDMVYKHARALLRDANMAEDVAQESFIKAFQNIRRFRGGSFCGWLLKITTNSAYDILRHSQRRPAQPLFLEDEYGEQVESSTWLVDPEALVQDKVEQNELVKSIYISLDELPEDHRSVLTLIDLYELNYQEASETLNVPIGTVKSRLARARLRIKEKLKTAETIWMSCLALCPNCE